MYRYVKTDKTGTLEPGSSVIYNFKRMFPSTISFMIVAYGKLRHQVLLSNSDNGPYVSTHNGSNTHGEGAYAELEEHDAPVLFVSVKLNATEKHPVEYAIYMVQYFNQLEEK